MKQTGTSDFSREYFNNVSEGDVECSSFSAEHQDANCVLNDDTRLVSVVYIGKLTSKFSTTGLEGVGDVTCPHKYPNKSGFHQMIIDVTKQIGKF